MLRIVKSAAAVAVMACLACSLVVAPSASAAEPTPAQTKVKCSHKHSHKMKARSKTQTTVIRRGGPSSKCKALGQAAKGKKIDHWCWAVNKYDEPTWVYGRIVGTKQKGWFNGKHVSAPASRISVC
ncbi:hypothetical protein [Streptomyces sp. TE33382]